MVAALTYSPDQWHDFFITIGGGSAALAGLVFVAISLNIRIVTRDPTHRRRAVGTLAGFMAAFMICSLALMGGQDHIALGVEWLVVAVIAAIVYVYGYVQAIILGGSRVGLRSHRLLGGTLLYLTEIVGAALLLLGYVIGIYVAAVSLVVLLTFMVSGSWLLIVGISEYDESAMKST